MADTATASDDELDRFFSALVGAEIRLYNVVEERMKTQGGLGAGSLRLLCHVRDHPGSRVADLAAAFAIGVGSTSKVIDRLEKQGWVERRPNPANRRSSLLALTPDGETVIDQALPAFHAALREALGESTTAQDLTTVSRTLEALRSNLEERRLGLPTG